jgi:5-(carboxyamino)imidazole ribonucleotide synthase
VIGMRLGVLGGGQLARMLALAAHPLGIRTAFYDPAADCCAADAATHFRGEYDDYAALFRFASAVDAVTFEFENVPVETAAWLKERVKVDPPPRALEVAQDRILEKDHFAAIGIPNVPYRAVESEADFRNAIQELGLPAVLKTRRFGYDGKGQAVLRSAREAETAWQSLGGRPLILEGFAPFERELSIVAGRGRDGECVYYPLVENEHREGMLDRTLAPAPNLHPRLQMQAEHFAKRLLDSLDYVGVLAIEFFLVNGELIANEMAPRVHNSGHWTQDGATTSQFENCVRAVCGLPLGRADALGHSAMLNLIGIQPDFAKILAVPGAKLHWYGKEPRPRRKVGHINVRLDSPGERDDVLELLISAAAGV